MKAEVSPVPGGVKLMLPPVRGRPVTFMSWLVRLHDDPAFAAQFSAVLLAEASGAFAFELPPLTEAALSRRFECVCIESPGLRALRPDPTPFAAHLDGVSQPVVVFDNLGGDALLVVPTVLDEPVPDFAHLERFLTHGGVEQVLAWWSTLAVTVLRRINDEPVWVSTAGLGVHWLHARLDVRPKYYRHAPYRQA